MLEFENLSPYELDSKEFEAIFVALAHAYMPQLTPNLCLELIITDSAHIREINQAHRNQDKPTDVLSFPLVVDVVDSADSTYPLSIGSVVLNAQMAHEVATELGHTLKDELRLLFIHGLLHIFGFDHECDDGAQRREEREWIMRFHLPTSLIERTQPLTNP